jgi:Zn-dependent M28 family amino/carboxypeptidase
MIRMPGDPFRGPLPPLTGEQHALEVVLRRHVGQLAGVIGERHLFRPAQLYAAADYIGSALKKAGLSVQRQSYEVSGRPVENVEAEITGATASNDLLLVGAHYDSVQGSPGANDNATGVAATLALAEAFAGTRPARTIRFVFFANEEPPFFQTPHMGSRVYAERSRQRGENIRLMLSLETIGYYTDEPDSQRYPFPLRFFYPSTGNFIAFVSNRAHASTVKHLLALFRRHAQFPSEGGALWESLPGVAWSDHWSFWQEGYAGVMITDTAPNRYPHYHTAADKPDQVDFPRMARVVWGLERVIRELAEESSVM